MGCENCERLARELARARNVNRKLQEYVEELEDANRQLSAYGTGVENALRKAQGLPIEKRFSEHSEM